MLWWTVLLFAVTAVAVGWLRVTGVDPDRDFSPAILLAGYAPLLATLILTTRRTGWRTLLAPLSRWRIHIGWYLLVVLGPLVLVAAADAGYLLIGDQPSSTWLVAPSLSMVGAAVGPMFSGAVGEEIGWRGFLQPRLQVVWSPLVASVAIGLLWATWHQWVLLAPGGSPEALDIAAGYLRLICTAVLYGWLYNTTRSLLLVMVAHAGHNLAVTGIPTPADPVWHLLLAIAYLIVAVVVVLAGRPGSSPPPS